MRPDQLAPLFGSARGLTGVGPRLETLLKKAVRMPPGIAEPRVIDLLWHLPTGVIDRRASPTIASALPGTIATLEVRVMKHRPSPRGNTKAPYKVSCEDDTGQIDLVFFHAERQFIERQLPVGATRFISGRIEHYNDRVQMTHPDYIVSPEVARRAAAAGAGLSADGGVSGKVLVKAMRQVLERVPVLTEWQEPDWLAKKQWPSLTEALTPAPSAGRCGRRFAGWRAVAADRLRRIARRPDRARSRAHEPEGAAGPRDDR